MGHLTAGQSQGLNAPCPGIAESLWEQACTAVSSVYILNAGSNPHILRHICSWMLVFIEAPCPALGVSMVIMFLGLLHFMFLQSWTLYTLVSLSLKALLHSVYPLPYHDCCVLLTLVGGPGLWVALVTH